MHKSYKCLSKTDSMYVSTSMTFDEVDFPFPSNSNFSSNILNIKPNSEC